MKRIELRGKQLFMGALILVNRDFPLKKRIARRGLCSVGAGVMLEKQAALALKMLLIQQKDIVSVSGFRSGKEQYQIYAESLKENGEHFTKSYVALPGHSEHECGLAIDVGENRQPIDFIRPSFPYKGACQEFRNKAPYYGFVQRYKKDKETITGIAHEPWHFRYVGFPHSLIMEEKGMSLEEYLQLLRQEKRIVWRCGGRTVEIRHAEADQTGSVIFHLKEEQPYQVSGDNKGGAILTLM